MFLGAESERFHVHNALNALYKVVQQHNLDDVANSIPHLCAYMCQDQTSLYYIAAFGYLLRLLGTWITG